MTNLTRSREDSQKGELVPHALFVIANMLCDNYFGHLSELW